MAKSASTSAGRRSVCFSSASTRSGLQEAYDRLDSTFGVFRLVAVADAAKEHGIYVLAGGLEEAGPDAFYNLLDFYTPEGKRAYRYKRCQSAGDGVDLPLFGRHVREGDELKVVETPHGNACLHVCS